jgi:hypothetical protein
MPRGQWDRYDVRARFRLITTSGPVAHAVRRCSGSVVGSRRIASAVVATPIESRSPGRVQWRGGRHPSFKIKSGASEWPEQGAVEIRVGKAVNVVDDYHSLRRFNEADTTAIRIGHRSRSTGSVLTERII